MSLPNSEPLPESLHELPPARQRHIRRRPRTASLAERQLLLDTLLGMSAPTLNFILLSLLGSLALGAALFFNDPAVLILALILLPFCRPIFNLALLPAARKGSMAIKSLISLLILILFILAAGVLAGWLKQAFPPGNLNLFRLSAPYWVDLILVCLSAALATFMMVRTGELPRLVGVLLTYEILVPLAAAGFAFPLGASPVFPGALLVSFTHFTLALFMAALTFFLLSFTPKRPAGWLLLLLPLLIALGSLLMSFPDFTAAIAGKTHSAITPSPTLLPIKTQSPLASATQTELTQLPATQTMIPSQTQTNTPEPTLTRTPTQTHTPEPTTFWAQVDTLQGAVLRESPTFEAPITGYLNDGDVVEIFSVMTNDEGSLWYRVETLGGQAGWLLGSLVNTQTPTPTPE